MKSPGMLAGLLKIWYWKLSFCDSSNTFTKLVTARGFRKAGELSKTV